MGDLYPLLETESRATSYFDTIRSKFAKYKWRAQVSKLKPCHRVADPGPGNEAPISPGGIDTNDIFAIYNPPGYYNVRNTEEAVPATECEIPEIIPSPTIDSTKKWTGVYIFVAVSLVVCAVLFTILVYTDVKKNHGVVTLDHL